MTARPQQEARSLSTINYLAANPPQYPYHPELRESLTLYISRVPGTQDIILSTFRPQRKNVTGEDIANSLYYIHLDTAQDDLLAAPKQQESVPSPRSSVESARSAIPRKPLPVSAHAPRLDVSSGALDTRNPPSPRVKPPRLSAQPLNAHSPALAAAVGASPAPQQPACATVEGYKENPMFRKRQSGNAFEAATLPTGPVPSAASIQRKALGHKVPSSMGAAHAAAPPFPPDPTPLERPVTPTQSTTLAPYPVGQAARLALPASPSKLGRIPSPGKTGRHPSTTTISLTLIRRDPTSGTQCNVGKISAFQTNVPTPDTADPNLDPEDMGEMPGHAQKIAIRLETSGYAKYRDMPSRADVVGHRPSPGPSFPQGTAARGAEGGTAGAERPTAVLNPAWRPVDEGFSRHVVMSYGQSWTANFKRALHRKDRSGSLAPPEDLATQRPFHSRQGSTSTIGSVDSADGSRSPTLITHPGPGLRPKGYVFLSPWNGRCEFRTSSNGRSLKCRHIVDAASAQRPDPREVAHSIRDAQAMGRSRGDELSSALLGAKPVSELRFNLPGSASSHGGSSDNGGQREPNHLSARFSKLLQRQSRHSSSSDQDADDDNDDGGDYGDESPMDLSLGREAAGGGSRGRRAKLGKLIIHDEGLKMLDLVVAANVGVWWTTWGRMQ